MHDVSGRTNPSKNINDKMEDVFLHNKLFCLIIKMIDGGRCSSAVVNEAIGNINSKLKEKKYDVDMSSDDLTELTQNAYEILRYLESHGIIMMIDVLRLKNYYKVSFEVFDKTEEEILKDFHKFLEFSSCSSQNSYKTTMKQLKSSAPRIKRFFLRLNNGLSVYETLVESKGIYPNIDNSFQRTMVYFLWMFGHYKRYLKRLYEIPIPKTPMPEEDKARCRYQILPRRLCT